MTLQKDYVYPGLHTTYIKQQEAVVEYLRDNWLHLSGDGHCDGPEYSPKYATYSIMDCATYLILEYSLVHVNETRRSVAIEKEGLRHFLDKLLDQGVDIISLTTDRHTGVTPQILASYLTSI